MDLTEVLELVIANAVGSINVALPAKVLSFDADKQTISAQIAVRANYADPDQDEDDEDVLVPVKIPPITNVPVMFPQGGGSSITWPLEKGDDVLLVFCDRSIDEWSSSGSGDNIPLFNRRHEWTDAVAYAGVRPVANPLEADRLPDDALALTHKATQVRVGDGTFAVENQANELVAVLTDLVNTLTTATMIGPSGTSIWDTATLNAITQALTKISSFKE